MPKSYGKSQSILTLSSQLWSKNTMPKISVIVPVEPHSCIDRVVAALGRQTLDPADFEVLVIDADHTADLTQTIESGVTAAPRGLNVRYLRVPKGGRAASQNQGVKHATTDLFLFLAGDFEGVPELVAEHLRLHEQTPDPRVVGVGPNQFHPDLEITPLMWWLDNRGKQFGAVFVDESRPIPAHFFYAANTSIKRAFLQQAGGFDEDFPYHAGDDFELGVRLFKLGMQAKFLPKAFAYHMHSIALDERRVALGRAGESAVIFHAKHAPNELQRRLYSWNSLFYFPTWLVALSARWFGLSASWSRLRHRVLKRQKDLELYYGRTMAQSFLEGYCRGRRRVRCDESVS